MYMGQGLLASGTLILMMQPNRNILTRTGRLNKEYNKNQTKEICFMKNRKRKWQPSRKVKRKQRQKEEAKKAVEEAVTESVNEQTIVHDSETGH